jgi:hypothetical protein
MPEARAPLSTRPDDEQPAGSDTTITPITASDLETANGPVAADVLSHTEEAPAGSLDQAESVPAGSAVPSTNDASSADAASINASVSETVAAADDVNPSTAVAEPEPLPSVAVEAPLELVASGALQGVALEADADEVEQSIAPSAMDEVPSAETSAAIDDVASATADVGVPEEVEVPGEVPVENVETVAAQVAELPVSVETPLAELADGATDQTLATATSLAEQADAEQPSEETLREVLPPVVVDIETAEAIEVQAAPMSEAEEAGPEPADDPVNAMEAQVIQNVRSAVAAPVNEVVPPPHVPPVAQPQVAIVEEFTPPPTATPSNVRWVKTINGTRLPLRPATED